MISMKKGGGKAGTFIVVYVALSSMFLTDLGENQNPFHTSANWKNILQTNFWLCTFQAISLPVPT